MIASALGGKGMWSRKALQRQPDSKGKKSGRGDRAGKGATGEGKLLLNGPGWMGTWVHFEVSR